MRTHGKNKETQEIKTPCPAGLGLESCMAKMKIQIFFVRVYVSKAVEYFSNLRDKTHLPLRKDCFVGLFVENWSHPSSKKT